MAQYFQVRNTTNYKFGCCGSSSMITLKVGFSFGLGDISIENNSSKLCAFKHTNSSNMSYYLIGKTNYKSIPHTQQHNTTYNMVVNLFSPRTLKHEQFF